MKFLSCFPDLLGSVVTPFCLLTTAIVLLPNIRPGRLCSPKSFLRALTDADVSATDGAKTSPFSALSVALAGTLGVGNITGVASALMAGGPGAVFWMWLGTIASITVKYAEVYLAVKFRREERGRRYGGAMYYIRDGLSSEQHLPRKMPYGAAAVLGGIFAVLCGLNSLVTGNIVQANAAVSVLPERFRTAGGVLLGILVLISLGFGRRTIEKITAKLIPPLTAVYMILAVTILVRNADLLPEVIGDIVRGAFVPRAVLGGTLGFTVREGIRYGVMRGIFSNEAGCGTSPTAHASAKTSSPFHQACFGVVEVVFDTLVLCTMTTLVLLTAAKRYDILPWKTDADAAAVTLEAFRALAGDWAYGLLTAAVILFAYGTILAQVYYGTAAVGYLTEKKGPLRLYVCVSAGCTAIGAWISSPVMWTIADLLLGIMTVGNCLVLILLRRSCRE